MANDLLIKIRSELKKSVDPNYNMDGGFKEKIKKFGVRIPKVRGISRKYYPQVKSLGKKEVFKLAEELMADGYMEEATIGFDWVYKRKREFKKSDFKLFGGWIGRYVDNWAKCDDFCCHSIGYLVLEHPGLVKELKKWARSKNMWFRRASAVTLVLPARKGRFLKEVLEISETLLIDKEDLVQKGYGWLLKETSKKHQKEVFDFVIKNKLDMPRTALRYAIEKMPEKLRKQAMK